MNQVASSQRPEKPTAFLCMVLIFLLFSSLSCFAADSNSASAQAESQAKLDQLKSGIKKMTLWLKDATSEKAGLNKELKQHEQKINQLSKEIRESLNKIQQNNKELNALNVELKLAEAKLETHRQFLQKQIQVAYFQEEHSTVKLLLNTENPQDLARQMRYFDYIKNARTEKISDINTLLKTTSETKDNIQVKTAELEESKLKLDAQKSELDKITKEKRNILGKLEKSIKNNSDRLEKMQADETRLKNLIKELEASIAKAKIKPREDAFSFGKQKAQLPRPSRAKVAQDYGSSVANGKLKLNGIRFQTNENDPVIAINSGRVIFSNWIRGFGLLIIVDHGNQFMSLYGNNKSLTKERGDSVKKGETIAFSTEYSPNYETGLYFEIRKDGKPLNPHLWLKK